MRARMTREDWHAHQEHAPLTGNQLGAILREFRRLGLDDPAGRAERLAVSAALLGLDGLASTGELTMGQAGTLLRLLLGCRSRAELPAVTLPAAGASAQLPAAAARGGAPQAEQPASGGASGSQVWMLGLFMLARVLMPEDVQPPALPG